MTVKKPIEGVAHKVSGEPGHTTHTAGAESETRERDVQGNLVSVTRSGPFRVSVEDLAKTPAPITATTAVNLCVRLHPEPDGGYSVDVPALPGCFSEGDTLEEALAGIREAAETWLLAAPDVMARAR